MVSSTVAVLPILFFTGLVARDFWKTAPPLAAVPSQLLAFEFEAGSPSPPPELATKEGKNRGGPLNPARLSATRWAKLAWLAEVKGWNYTNASEFNGTLRPLRRFRLRRRHRRQGRGRAEHERGTRRLRVAAAHPADRPSPQVGARWEAQVPLVSARVGRRRGVRSEALVRDRTALGRLTTLLSYSVHSVSECIKKHSSLR